MSTRPKSTCCGRDDFRRNNHGVSVEPRTTRAAIAQHLHRETDAFIRTDSLGEFIREAGLAARTAGQECAEHVRAMSGLPPKADIG